MIGSVVAFITRWIRAVANGGHEGRTRHVGMRMFAAPFMPLRCARAVLGYVLIPVPFLTPFCPFGVDLYKTAPASAFDLAALRVGWYVDYRVEAMPHVAGMDYAGVISLYTDAQGGYGTALTLAQIAAAVAANPGADWLIGNEPDRRAFQDDLLPELYAQAYHDLYAYVKQLDPTAQVFAGNIVQPTPLRLEYLDRVLAGYAAQYGRALPVDGWSIHNFILNEQSCDAHPESCWGAGIPRGIAADQGMVITYADHGRVDLFVAQIERFRAWMATNGYGDKPLLVSEYGILMPAGYGYGPAVVNKFMADTATYMLAATDAATGYAPDGGRLVQRFAWYATLEPTFNGALFVGSDPEHPLVAPYVPTALGNGYAALTAAITPSVAIGLPVVAIDPPTPPGGSDPFTATVQVLVAGQGNLVGAQPVLVTVAAGAQGPAVAQRVEVAGCGDAAQLTFVLGDLPPDGLSGDLLTIRAEGVGAPVVVQRAYFREVGRAYLPWVGE